MKPVYMWLGFAVAFIIFQFVGNDLFPASSGGGYTLERAVASFVIGGAGAAIGRAIGGLLEGEGQDSA